MRYRGDSDDFYEAPGVTTTLQGQKEVSVQSWNGNVIKQLYVDVWGGKLLPYQSQYELGWLDHFCTSVKGTGVNELRGDLNHAGDAGRDRACANYLVVNDMAARGVP